MKTLLTTIILFAFVLNSQSQTKKAKAPVKVSVNAKYIVGTWKSLATATGNGMDESQTWMFTKTDFNMEDAQAFKQKGKYKVIREKGDTLVLKLFKQEGKWGTADKEQKLVLDKKNSGLRIGWLDFRRKE